MVAGRPSVISMHVQTRIALRTKMKIVTKVVIAIAIGRINLKNS